MEYESYSDEEGNSYEENSMEDHSSDRDLHIDEKEYKDEFAAFQRTSKHGAIGKMIDPTVYALTQTGEEKANIEIKKALAFYDLESDDSKYTNIFNKLTVMDNLEIYNPELLVLASLFLIVSINLSKKNLNDFIKLYNLKIIREDLIRYIRLLDKPQEKKSVWMDIHEDDEHISSEESFN